jgi:hypothetical protein
MLQPSRAQWIVICTTVAIVILCWPPDRGHGTNLLIKGLHWAVDPAGSLPSFPPPLPPGLGDDGDAVAAHDAIESEYYRLYNSSKTTRWRMDVKAAGDPFDPTTERQVLVAGAAIAALVAWRIGKHT